MRSVSEKRLQRTVALVCATLFVAFSFTFILYKTSLLEVLYDNVATGKLEYNSYITSGIITVALTLFAFWLNKFMKFQREWTALAYLPSCIILAFITDINRTIYNDEGNILLWIYIFLSVVLFNLFISFILRRILFAKIKDYNVEGNRMVWRNMMLFTFIFLLTGTLSDSDRNFMYESVAYTQYKHGNINAALEVAKNDYAASKELTSSRAFYLAMQGEMSDKLFNYPQHFASEGLLPHLPQSTPLSPDTVYKAIGVQNLPHKTVLELLQESIKGDSISKIHRDYYLCALLLDKRILQFRDELSRHYNINNVDSLPVHYKEAVLLYNYVSGNGEVKDTTIQRKFEALHSIAKQCNNNLLNKKDGTYEELKRTYWWYYLYE